MILNSPVSVTAHLIGQRSPDAVKGESNVPPAVEDWMSEKSREELSNLLVAAGDIIKSRETGMYISISVFVRRAMIYSLPLLN